MEASHDVIIPGITDTFWLKCEIPRQSVPLDSVEISFRNENTSFTSLVVQEGYKESNVSTMKSATHPWSRASYKLITSDTDTSELYCSWSFRLSEKMRGWYKCEAKQNGHRFGLKSKRIYLDVLQLKESK